MAFVSVRSGRYLQSCGLHHLSWWRRNVAVRVFAFPGIHLEKIIKEKNPQYRYFPLLHNVYFLAGERPPCHGLPPGLSGLPDAVQVRYVPVSGHADHRRLVNVPPTRPSSRSAHFFSAEHGAVRSCVPPPAGNAAIVLRSRLQVRVLKENWEKKDTVDEKGIILTNKDLETSRKAMQYQVRDVIPAP